jgi:hypothetical protein
MSTQTWPVEVMDQAPGVEHLEHGYSNNYQQHRHRIKVIVGDDWEVLVPSNE